MKIKDAPKHGEKGHFHDASCPGYAKGGVVSQDAMDLSDIASSGMPLAADPEMLQKALNSESSQDAKDLADIAASGAPIAADEEMLDAGLKGMRGYAKGGRVPEQLMDARARNRGELGMAPVESGIDTLLDHTPVLGILRQLGNGKDLSDRLANPELLHNTVGKPLETNYQRGAPWDKFGKEADVQMMSKGGVAGIEGLQSNPDPKETVSEVGMAGEKDPAEIPEEIREYVESAHKAIRESRPDENWRIKSAEKPESVAPYIKDEEEDHGEGENTSGIPNFDEGGPIPDPNADLADLAPLGTGILTPSPAPQAPNPSPVVAPAAPAPVMPPKPPVSASTALTDQDFMARANKMLGLDPTQTASFMKMLGDRSQKAQIGAGVAGIGDAIAAGGTLGKVNPGALNKSEELIQGRTKEGLEGMQTIRDNQKESFGLGQTLRGNEPFSPEIQKSLVTQFHIPAGLAGSPRDVIYKMLDPIAQTQLKEAELAASQSYKTQALDLQKKQLEATIGNQKAERDIAREGHQAEAAKTLADRGILKTLANSIPYTSGHNATKILEKQAEGIAPDVSAYAQKHGITVEQAQAIKDKRTGGQ